jgi:hypothetical protein
MGEDEAMSEAGSRERAKVERNLKPALRRVAHSALYVLSCEEIERDPRAAFHLAQDAARLALLTFASSRETK